MDGGLWLHPDDDLAPNRPGEHLHARAKSVRCGVAGLRGALWRHLTWATRREDVAHVAACELRAAEAVGAELDALAGAGWRVLHAVPLPGGLEIGHLLIGPGGIYCVRATWCRARNVTVAHDQLHGGPGTSPVVRHLVRAATLAAHALTRATTRETPGITPGLGTHTFTTSAPWPSMSPVPVAAVAPDVRVPVRAVLVPVGARHVTVLPGLEETVRVQRVRELGGFARRGGELAPATVERLYHTARDRRVWNAL